MKFILSLSLFCICGIAMAQHTSQHPHGLYKLTEIVHQDGKRMEPNFIQYKCCLDEFSFSILCNRSYFDRAPFSFSITNSDGKPLRYTGELSKMEDKGTQIFGQSIDHEFTLRWYNRGSFNETFFPANSNIDEIYHSVKDSTDMVLKAVDLLQMKIGTQIHRLQGAWKLRGQQSRNNARSQYWVEKSQTNTYQIFGEKHSVTVFTNEQFPQATLNCYFTPCQYLSEEAFQQYEQTSIVNWLDANTVSITNFGEDGHPCVNIWDRCGLPSNIQSVFGTTSPIMTKDISRFCLSDFKQQYGEKPDSICLAFETYDYAVKANEQNNAIFPKLMEAGFRGEYEALRDTLEAKVLRGEINADEAVGRYTFWFFQNFDRHTHCNSETFSKLIPEALVDYSKYSKHYSPEPVGCKVDQDTYLLRLPSCMGQFPTWEWLQKKADEFKQSGAQYLILDLRGNGGGNDQYSTLFTAFMCDTPAKREDKTVYRSSMENNKQLKKFCEQIPGFFGERVYAETSKVEDGDFLSWVINPKGSGDFSPLVKKGAIIIDNLTASAAETAVRWVRTFTTSRAKVYGNERTYGSDKTGNINTLRLPNSSLEITFPMTVDADFEITCKDRQPGWKADVKIPLPYPETLTDNIDPWVLWVAKKMKQ